MNTDFLHPLPKDERDIKLGAVAQLPKLSELPDNFEHDPLDIKNQMDSDFCTAFSTCGASQLQEDDILVPEYQFALIKELMGGDVTIFGADLRVAMKSHQKVGALSEKYRPQGYTLAEKGSDFLRRIENWPPELKEKALEHRKKAYVDVTGQYDYFDDIRASIWLFRAEKRVPVLGVRWSWSLKNPYLEKPNDGGGHALYASGWRTINGKKYLVIPNSYGTQAGDNGKFYMSREAVNAFVSIFGAFMFIDYTPDELRKIIEDNKNMNILQQILNIIKKILGIDQQIIQIKPPVIPVQPPVPPITPQEMPPADTVQPAPQPQYIWDNPKDARHSVRLICDEEGVSMTKDILINGKLYSWKDILCGCIEQESGFKPNAIGKINDDGTRDWGICQFNDGKNKQGVPYWIGEGAAFTSTDYVLNNPEKCVRLMAKLFKQGKQGFWSSYKTGAYKNHL